MSDFTSSGKTNGGVAIFGRIAGPSGRVIDRIFEGTVDLKVNRTLKTQHLIERPSELSKEPSKQAGQALAFVSIGFGPAPSSEFDRLLWKGGFDEAKHPRMPEGSSEGGEFCSAEETSNADDSASAIDNLNNQNVVLKDLTTKIGKRAARRALRNRLVAGLRLLAGLTADAAPVAGEIFDAYEIARTIEDSIALEKDVTAAMTFVTKVPDFWKTFKWKLNIGRLIHLTPSKKTLLGNISAPQRMDTNITISLSKAAMGWVICQPVSWTALQT